MCKELYFGIEINRCMMLIYLQNLSSYVASLLTVTYVPIFLRTKYTPFLYSISPEEWLHYHNFQGMTEPVQRLLKHHDIASTVRPHRNLRQILVHPQDKVEDKHKTNCVYQMPCKTCNMCYMGETGRTFGTRLDEYKKVYQLDVLLWRQGNVRQTSKTNRQ